MGKSIRSFVGSELSFLKQVSVLVCVDDVGGQTGVELWRGCKFLF